MASRKSTKFFTCAVSSCDRVAKCKGHCFSHYRLTRKPTELFSCKIDTCDRIATQFGLCNAHYCRIREYGSAHNGKHFKSDRINFLRAYSLHEDTLSCVLWPFLKSTNGYGTCVTYNGKPQSPHVIMCLLAHGEPTSDALQAAHSCGNRLCVNPNHLRWATPKDNSHDKVAHGTSRRGSQINNAALNEAQVAQILLLRKTKRLSYKQLAAIFCVSPGIIGYIVRRQTWKHVTLPPENEQKLLFLP